MCNKGYRIAKGHKEWSEEKRIQRAKNKEERVE